MNPRPSSAEFNRDYCRLELCSPEVLDMVSTAAEWMANCLANIQGGPRLLVLCGNNGTGKTRVLRGLQDFLKRGRIDAWAAGWWPKNPPEVRYADWTRWANLDPSRTDEERMAMEDLNNPEVLLLDDIGAEVDRYKSGLALANLCDLLTARAWKWTAVTTNYLPENWVGTETAPGRFGKRVGDRLFRASLIVCLRTTPSWALAHPGK